jgi:uncharacterized membrane protein YfcA
VAGAGLGAVTGVLGVGGGFLAVPALVGVLGMRMRHAVGTSLLVITVNSLAALATRAETVEGLDRVAVGPFIGAATSAHGTAGACRRAVAAFMLIDAVA